MNVNVMISTTPKPLRSPFTRSSLRTSGTYSSSKVPQRVSSNPSFASPSVELLSNTNSQATSFLELLSKTREGLKYHEPELCDEGVNGTYFLKDKNGTKIAVFKPQDEEGNSESNPKLSLLATLDKTHLPNKGIRPGEAALREVAASILDREHFYGVPKTQLVKITHRFGSLERLVTKIGSLQEFIENDGCSEDFGYRSYSTNEVHKIGILDVQMLNVDRHAGNVLIRKSRNGSLSLIPIDHGFSLPDRLECSWFEWMNWPQSKLPFDDDIKSFILRIDIERDTQMLRKELGIRRECLSVMAITTTLLKKAVEFNLTLYDIGLLLCRKSSSPSSPSPIELIYEKARSQLELELHGKNSTSSTSSSSSLDERNEREVVDIPISHESLFFDILSKIMEHDLRNAKHSECKYPALSKRI